ncbi:MULTISPECIES: UbiA family prenyltransferase [unclassified Schlesneria]|uniref:UbiA family prenyltransferase n=1 Tax=Schlesneria TaxID=656899 RepID=UPI00359FAFE4
MLPYLQLLRLPTVFTAMADIILGFVLTQGFLYGPLTAGAVPGPALELSWNHPLEFVGLLVASACLYLSGMVFNDVFDVQQDTAERPGRPIPSGRVTLRSAAMLGCVLMMVGVGAAAAVSLVSMVVAMLLVIAILGYDSYLKRTPLGPLAMGTCRFLNVLLGGSLQTQLADLLNSPLLPAAIGLGTYIVGVTVFARTEARTSSRWQLALAQLIMNVGFGVLIWLMVSSPGRSAVGVSLAMLLVVAFTINRRGLEALRSPSPATVQGSIKVMLLSLVILDATLIHWHLNQADGLGIGVMHAIATSLLVVPAMLLSRFIPMT